MSQALIAGCATPDATHTIASASAETSSYRVTADGIWCSTIGVGTGRHAPTDAVDNAYEATIARALTLGCTLLDTAISYRHQRSERVIGAVLAAEIEAGRLRREEVIIASKAGYVPFDRDEPADPDKWIHQTYIASGLAGPHEFVSNYRHCIAPAFLEQMIAHSRANLGLQTIDIYYLHNPETQRINNSHETFRRRMLDAFETLEQAAERGDIGAYGLATWTGLRLPPKAPDYLSLAELVGLAYEVAGEAHHFKYVQLPYNALMPEAYMLENQQVGEAFLSPLGAAEELGLTVISSVPIHQGRLAVPMVPILTEAFPHLPSDAARAIQFARSTPGVCAVLTGSADVAHIAENMTLLREPPATPTLIDQLFGR